MRNRNCECNVPVYYIICKNFRSEEGFKKRNLLDSGQNVIKVFILLREFGMAFVFGVILQIIRSAINDKRKEIFTSYFHISTYPEFIGMYDFFNENTYQFTIT